MPLASQRVCPGRQGTAERHSEVYVVGDLQRALATGLHVGAFQNDKSRPERGTVTSLNPIPRWLMPSQQSSSLVRDHQWDHPSLVSRATVKHTSLKVIW
jgi:hypothetical protein